MAVCALLLVSTIIVLRSEQRALSGRPDLDFHGVWDLRTLPRFQARVVERLRREAGVEAVAVAYRAPLYGGFRHAAVRQGKETLTTAYNFVSADYFAVFHIPVLRGRLFTSAEAETLAPVAVVSDSAARRFWPHQDPIGQDIPADFDGRPVGLARTVRIVGVVRDSDAGFPYDSETSCLFLPTNERSSGLDSVLVRLQSGGANPRQRLEAALAQIDSGVADMINPLDDMAGLMIYPFRVAFWVMGFLGGIALLLTVSGIYGVLAYAVSQRTREIGIRVALGAGSGSVVAMVVRQSARLVVLGAAAGLALALAVAPLAANQIAVVKPYDWVAYTGTAAVVLGAALAAAYAPARRAVRIDPVQTLRCD